MKRSEVLRSSGSADVVAPLPLALCILTAADWVRTEKAHLRYGPIDTYYFVAVPVLPILPVSWMCARAWSRRRTRNRAAQGLCPACGYDLRASQNRCPECGTPVLKGEA